MAAIFQIRRGTSETSLQEGELYLNQTSGSLQMGSGSSTITLAKLNQPNIGNFNVTGDVTIGGTITIGDATTDNLVINADLSSSIIPNNDNAFDLGSTSLRYRSIYANNISGSKITGSFSGSISGVAEGMSAFSTSLDLRLDKWEASASLYDVAMSGSKRLYVSPSGSDANDGLEPYRPFKTIAAAVASLGSVNPSVQKRYTIFVGSGEYVEQNPITLHPGLSIVGDNLRTVRLTAANPTKDFFHVHDGNYINGLRFLDLQYPAFAFSFPASTVKPTISGGTITSASIIHSLSGYTANQTGLDVGIIVEGPDASGSVPTARVNTNASGQITAITFTGGTNYTATETPHISIPAPVAQRPSISTSPYIQNCSSITGPFTTTGVKIPVTTPLPYDVTNVFGGGEVVDENGAGGGLRIDGNLCSATSPLRSFVADAFTQVNQGGPGHLIINNGYTQFVSCFTTFCTYGFKTANGGFANVSNSVIDFGKYGIISKTYFPTTYNTGSSLETKTSQVSGFILTDHGSGYTYGQTASVSITGGGYSVQATAYATINADTSINEIKIINSGSGYTSQPTVTLQTPTGSGARIATTQYNLAEISGVSSILVSLQTGSRGIDISSNMILSGSNYLVTAVTLPSGSSSPLRRVTTYPAPPSVNTGDPIKFYQLSNISTGGLVMEYVGSGVTYNALPFYGGVPVSSKEVTQISPGRVFYSTFDNIGNLKIGSFFAVNQLTGEVTINANSFNLSGLNAIGPFKRNGVAVGVQLQEVSDDTNLLNSQGIHGQDTVPTQNAVYTFVSAVSSSISSSVTSISSSISSSINSISSSISSSIGVLNSKLSTLASVTSSYNTFTASVNGHISDINTKTGSFETKFSTLQNLTGSFETTGRGIISSSAQLSGTTITNLTITNLTTVNQTASVVFSSGSNRFGDFGNDIHSFTGSVQISGSIVTIGSSTATSYNGTINATNGVVSGSSQVVGILSSLNTYTGSQDTKNSTLATYTASVNSQLSNLNTATSSYETKGGGIVSSSAQITAFGFVSSSTPLTSLNTFTSSINVWSSSIATTGSNSFNGNQQITGSLLVSQNITGSASASFISLAVNTATPAQKIHLKGIVGIEAGTTGGNTADQIVFGYNGSGLTQYTHKIQTGHDAQSALNRMDFLIANSSNTWKTPLQLRPDVINVSGSLIVTGSITATDDITAFATSDIRLKENIIPIPNALTKVNQISGNTYDWKEGFDNIHNHKGNDVGVIAQEIEAVLPQLVVNRDNGYKAVQYEKIIPLLIEAIKELSNKIDRLENK